MRPVLWVLYVIVNLSVSGDGFAASWWNLEQRKYSTGKGGETVEANVITVDLKAANLRLVSVPFEVGQPIGSTEVSVQQLGRIISTRRNYQKRDWLLVNGGFSSYQADVPLGLLVIDGRVYSNVNKERSRETGVLVTKSRYSGLRWSGILCQSQQRGQWSVIATLDYAPGGCFQALQAGPVPVEPESVVAISPQEPGGYDAYARTVVCIGAGTSMKVVLTRRAHLRPLAVWMSTPEAAGGLGCRVAVNLSGDTSSGAAIFSPRTGLKLIGEGSFPIPSALLFEGK